MDALIIGFPLLWQGFTMTLLLLVISGFFAFVIGVVIVAMRISPVAPLRMFAVTYTEIVRNTPLTLMLFFCAFVLPYLGVNFDYMTFALIGLSVYTSPFIAEALRSGVNGVPIGQAEAARSVGLGFVQSLTTVVLPQALRTVIPPLINVFIALTKNTSVAGGFAVFELIAASREVINKESNPIWILAGAAALYLCVTVPLGLIAGKIEKKVQVLR